jgi:hypothetical protein
LAGELTPDEAAGGGPRAAADIADDGTHGFRARLRPIRTALADPVLLAAVAAPLVALLAVFLLVIPTLAPGMVSHAGGDTAEFQAVAWVLGTAHPTGYPSYIVLGWLFEHLVPFGEPAWRLNLLEACLSAGAIAAVTALVQLLTGARWIALATGLLLLVMPGFSSVAVSFPEGGGIQSTPVFWRLSTYADPHLFHLALTALVFLLLLTWERRRAAAVPGDGSHPDRWLVAAAAVYGVALANHSLTVMLAPGIALFVLATHPGVILRPKLILAAAGFLAAMTVGFWLELPIRAAMHAPLVYAHPDTWNGFLYVITGQQFGGIPPSISHELGQKADAVLALMSSWLGPFGYLALAGLAASVVLRPRYVLLTLPAAALTSAFAAAYANSDLERYFLVPAFVAFSYVGLGVADLLGMAAMVVELIRDRVAPRGDAAADVAVGAASGPGPDGDRPSPGLEGLLPAPRGLWLLAEVVLLAAVVATSLDVLPNRTATGGSGAVSQASETSRESWMKSVLAPADQGGLPANSVIVGNWYDDTALWYGQLVLGLRPDIHVVDDSMRVAAGDNLGQVWDVIDSYLDKRPVFLLRFSWNCDGMDSLVRFYDVTTYSLPNGVTIPQVNGKIGPVTCS